MLRRDRRHYPRQTIRGEPPGEIWLLCALDKVGLSLVLQLTLSWRARVDATSGSAATSSRPGTATGSGMKENEGKCGRCTTASAAKAGKCRRKSKCGSSGAKVGLPQRLLAVLADADRTLKRGVGSRQGARRGEHGRVRDRTAALAPPEAPARIRERRVYWAAAGADAGRLATNIPTHALWPFVTLPPQEVLPSFRAASPTTLWRQLQTGVGQGADRLGAQGATVQLRFPPPPASVSSSSAEDSAERESPEEAQPQE
eukprot:1529102-Rhodomonas_salina.2